MCFVARHVPSAQAWLLVVYDKKRKKKEEESPSEAKPVHPKREVLAGDERSQRGSPFFLCHQSVILVIKHPPTAAALSLFLSSYRRPPAVFPFISTRARSSAPRSLGGARRRREDGEERAGDARLRQHPPPPPPPRRSSKARRARGRARRCAEGD